MAYPPDAERLRMIDLAAPNLAADFAREVRAGLTAQPKRLPCRYFYDREGSLLFEAICALPEYYLARAEGEVLRTAAAEIAGDRGRGLCMIELGGGSAAKTRMLIEALLRGQPRLEYVAIDLARAMLEESARALISNYAGLTVTGIVGEYEDGLCWLDGQRRDTARLVLWLGSNIGNLERTEAAGFLRRIRDRMEPADRLLVGIDLRKDAALLERAYDDSQGVTARFNKNILARINRELGGRFDLEAFGHRAVYDGQIGRIEMHLVSRRAQRVAIKRLGIEACFAEGEAIHTENSYKYSPAEIDALAYAAGLTIERQWSDSARRFSDCLLSRSDG